MSAPYNRQHTLRTRQLTEIHAADCPESMDKHTALRWVELLYPFYTVVHGIGIHAWESLYSGCTCIRICDHDGQLPAEKILKMWLCN